MAKDNLFLGMARGSVGDVTLYRANGTQLSRARNRHPSNPNSTKQAIQRAVNASVARLYSLTRALTDHSFQGLRVGQENQRAFTKRNMAILRSLVLTAINDNLADTATDARVSAPGLSVAVPFVGAQMSSGNYPQSLFEYKLNTLDTPSYHLPAVAAGGETVAEYAARVGLIAGDIYTILAVSIGTSAGGVNPLYSVGGTDYAKVYQSYFDYCQLMVKDGLSANTNPMGSDITYGDLFDTVGGTQDISALQPSAQPLGIDEIATFVSNTGCICCIRSRWDEDKRSTSFLQAARGNAGMAYGLTPAYLLAAWRDKLGIDDVELILEGENFSGVSGSDSLVVSATVVYGLGNLASWPMEDTQVVVSPTVNVITVIGRGIASIDVYRSNSEDGARSVLEPSGTVNIDGTRAEYKTNLSNTAGYYWLYINGEQYGAVLQITE